MIRRASNARAAFVASEASAEARRPRLTRVSLAVAMRERGESWRETYTACLPKDLQNESQQLAQTRLPAAVRARVRRKSRFPSSGRDTEPLPSFIVTVF